MVSSGITREEVIQWGGAEVFNQALALVNAGDVVKVEYDDAAVEIRGKIDQRNGWEMPVSLKLRERGRIESHCPCIKNQKWGQVCEHVVALGLALSVLEEDAREAEDGPLGERALAEQDQPASAHAPEPDWIEVPMKPKFYALVSGSRAALSIALDAWYGEIDFPACSIVPPRTVYFPDPNDDLVRRVRSLAAEKEAVQHLETEWGFQPGYKEGDFKLYLADPQKVLNFLGAGVPDLRRRGWMIDFSERLEKVVDGLSAVVPLVRVKDAPDGAFDVQYVFETVDGEEVSPVEIQAALNRHDGCLLRDGKVYLFDNRAIETMHGVFRDCATTQGGAPAGWFRVKGIHSAYVKSSLETLGDVINLDDSAARHWRETAAQRNRDANAKFEPVALGALDTVLRPYQKQGVYWMRFLENAGLAGLLADEMGLGKTLQTLTWLSLPRDKGPALIVCPTSLVRNWEAEAKKFTPGRKVLVVSGPDRARAFPAIPSADLVVTSYALLQRDFEDAYAGREFAAVVLDEAQHIKNRRTKNAQSVKLLNAARRLVLTGTPIENSVADVWSIFDFLMPGYLGEYEAFKFHFEDPIGAGGARGEEAQASLKRKLHPFILRRLKQTVAKDLPDKIVKVSYCPMGDDAQREYNEVLAKTRRAAGDAIKARGFAASKFAILAMLMKLRQLASVAKLDAFLEQL